MNVPNNVPFFVGNDAIHNLTQANNSLYISITLTNGTTLYELYELFRISNEQDNYRLSIGGTASGTLGMASFLISHNKQLEVVSCNLFIIKTIKKF